MALYTIVTMPGDGIRTTPIFGKIADAAIHKRSADSSHAEGSASPCLAPGVSGYIERVVQGGRMGRRYVLSEYVEQAMAEALYDKLGDAV